MCVFFCLFLFCNAAGEAKGPKHFFLEKRPGHTVNARGVFVRLHKSHRPRRRPFAMLTVYTLLVGYLLRGYLATYPSITQNDKVWYPGTLDYIPYKAPPCKTPGTQNNNKVSKYQIKTRTAQKREVQYSETSKTLTRLRDERWGRRIERATKKKKAGNRGRPAGLLCVHELEDWKHLVLRKHIPGHLVPATRYVNIMARGSPGNI